MGSDRRETYAIARIFIAVSGERVQSIALLSRIISEFGIEGARTIENRRRDENSIFRRAHNSDDQELVFRFLSEAVQKLKRFVSSRHRNEKMVVKIRGLRIDTDPHRRKSSCDRCEKTDRLEARMHRERDLATGISVSESQPFGFGPQENQ